MAECSKCGNEKGLKGFREFSHIGTIPDPKNPSRKISTPLFKNFRVLCVPCYNHETKKYVSSLREENRNFNIDSIIEEFIKKSVSK